ncbi:protein-glutamate methylesterase/protein-glutamine glutaminase [Neptunomonas qingdaonensis]|uniref:Protein-glutamate methylesterase/protein-glutamine glutaminase n=1 Tax=Neptunomonas qingdaonensis TaxID=1045558 RepID=A0A1I2UE64_9GAMM|nr:chemotaxis response regulator protein-glutamate methylesterase [Neptunomonas qingdaonensis]SFG73116.1 two-component system, chemotaxis family, response regulator CheB [Neptunomonas qingdaonensis]
MERVKVLIIDDSALVCQVITSILSGDPAFEVVGAANDPYEAREMIKVLKPDVLTLDIEMPRMDGITFLRNLMRLHPLPVVMLSTFTARGADATLQALALGAVDYMQKPLLGAQGIAAADFSAELKDKLKAAASLKNKIAISLRPALHSESMSILDRLNLKANQGHRVIAIGASTGGTEALQDVLSVLPLDTPPIVIVQHISASFSQRLASRINRKSAILVVEATDGQRLESGVAYLAPGGKHLKVKRQGAFLVCKVEDSELVNRHKPSVGVLFDSLLSADVEVAIAILLTGMGSDGAEAMFRLKEAGAYTVAQDEATSMIWGMPGSAVKLGAAVEVLPLNEISQSLVQWLQKS